MLTYLNRFILVLEDGWKDVIKLHSEFSAFTDHVGEGKSDLSFEHASEFLRKHGVSRNDLQVAAELKDISILRW
jgi:hypothetical protein